VNSVNLHELAELALKIARADLKRTKGADPVFVLAYPDGSTRQLPSEKLAPLMNEGRAKDAIFDAARLIVRQTGAVAAVFCTEAWMGRSTGAARNIPVEEFKRLSREHKFETLVQMGMVERTEVIVATAQDAHSVTVLSQGFRRQADGAVYSFGEVDVKKIPQAEFEGRQKMFGDCRRENVR
jgi:hypothetical protein